MPSLLKSWIPLEQFRNNIGYYWLCIVREKWLETLDLKAPLSLREIFNNSQKSLYLAALIFNFFGLPIVRVLLDLSVAHLLLCR